MISLRPFTKPALASAVAFVALSVLSLPATSEAQTVRTIRWAAIGDMASATTWPARVVTARIPMDTLVNYFQAGGTALRSGDSSYWTSGRLTQIFANPPDIITLQFGSADSKPVNWDDSANFVKDCKALIDTLATLPTQPRIIIVYPTPVWKSEAGTQDPGLRRGSIIANSIIPKLRAIAIEKGTDTVNLHAPLLARQTLFTDSISPTTAGNDTLGRLVFNGFVEQSIRVMCVGNSITEATSSSVKQRYVSRLRMMLGKRYWVWNGGKSGWWMQRAQLPAASASFKSYITDKPLMDTIFMRKPHYITVKLGTNDARKYFWQGSRFVNDYRYFIDTLYNNMTPKPKFVLFKAYPAWKVNGNWAFPNTGWTADTSGINGDFIRDSLGPAIDVIAASRPTQVAGVVDLYAPFAGPTQVFASDGVHPNATGQDSMARVIYRTMLPITTSIVPGSKASFVRSQVGAARRVHLTGGVAPEWMRNARVSSVDGKAIRIGADGKLPAGIYFVKPVVKSEALRVGTGK